MDVDGRIGYNFSELTVTRSNDEINKVQENIYIYISIIILLKLHSLNKAILALSIEYRYELKHKKYSRKSDCNFIAISFN